MKSKYTPEMVAAIEKAARVHGALSFAICNELAATPLFDNADISARGIAAKARTLSLPYDKKVRMTKTGAPVLRKDDIVVKIEDTLGVEGLASLAKAEKPALRKLLQALTENA
jgi:hypothetical protein